MHTEVAIVGAGLAGSSVAWHLAPHARVLVVDRGAQPGAEASADNAAMIRRLVEGPDERALAQRTHDFLEAPGPDWADQPPSVRTGAVVALVNASSTLHEAAARMAEAGVGIERVQDPGAVAPLLAGARLAHAWHLPDERVADPHALVAGFVRGAARSGASFRMHTQVEEIVCEGGRVRGLRTSAGDVDCERVVLAAGAWCGRLVEPLGLERPLYPLRRTLLHARRPPSAADHPWCWLDDVGLYLRPESGGWLGSACDEALDANAPMSRSSAGAYARALAQEKVALYLPAAEDLRWSGGWSGLRTFAPDRRPLLGADPEVEGLHWAAGLGGFGVTCSYAVGEAVAASVLGQPVPWLDEAAVSPGRSYPASSVLGLSEGLDGLVGT